MFPQGLKFTNTSAMLNALLQREMQKQTQAEEEAKQQSFIQKFGNVLGSNKTPDGGYNWNSPELQSIIMEGSLKYPSLTPAIGNLQKMSMPQYDISGSGENLIQTKQMMGQPIQATPLNLFQPTQKPINIDYQDLAGKDNKPHTWKIYNDPLTGEEIKREDMGVKYEKPASEQYKDARRLQLMLSLPEKYNNDAQVKKELQKMDAATMIRDIVDSNTPIEAASVPTFMARLSGEVGNLSEADKRPFGGTRAIMGKLEQFGKEMASGTLTEENKGYVKKIVDTIEAAAMKNLNRRSQILAKQYGTAAKDIMSPDEIMNIFESGIPKPIGVKQSEEPVNNIQKISNDAEYDALPSGTTFIDPNGVTRRKP